MDDSLVAWQHAKDLHKEGKLHAAATAYHAAIESGKLSAFHKANCYNNLGVILGKWGHDKLAVQSFVLAHSYDPESAEVIGNLGNYALEANQFESAKELFDAALERVPDNPDNHMNSAMLRLMMGDMPRGWREYYWRWKVPTFGTKPLKTPRPWWRGAPIEGRRLLVWHEQGFGDSIQFVRYLPIIKARYKPSQVRFLGPPELKSLLKGQCGIDDYVVEMDSEGPFDWHVPLLDLPGIVGTRLETIPSDVPYLNIPTEDIGWLGVGPCKVGLCWAGRKEHGKDKYRSMPWETMNKLCDVPGVSWFSFQFGDRRVWIPDRMTDVADYAVSFRQTAKWLQNMDLLITVDTAVAHLAGSLGVKTWLLLPTCPDFRWMLKREDTPWYPTMRLFRQKTSGDWAEVIERVKGELNAFNR